jgi:hypothetical protein
MHRAFTTEKHGAKQQNVIQRESTSVFISFRLNDQLRISAKDKVVPAHNIRIYGGMEM